MIPPDVRLREGYNHIGDIAWDRREGGRMLLPLECYSPAARTAGTPAGTGSIGVADPASLRVALLRQARPRGDPEGDVERGVARRHAAVDLERRRPAGLPHGRYLARPRGARRTRRSTPCGACAGRCRRAGSPGATFVGDRMFVAGQTGGPFRVWSIDLVTGAGGWRSSAGSWGSPRGSTAALDGGTLHWLIQPFSDEPGPPTYSADKATLLSFRPAGRRASVRVLRRSRSTVLRHNGLAAAVHCPDGCTATLRVLRGRELLARTIKHAARRAGARRARSSASPTAGGRSCACTAAGCG